MSQAIALAPLDRHARRKSEHHVGEGLARDQLGHQEHPPLEAGRSVQAAHPEGPHNLWMPSQTRAEASLVAVPSLGVGCIGLRRHHLEGDLASTAAEITRPIHDRHPATRELLDDLHAPPGHDRPRSEPRLLVLGQRRVVRTAGLLRVAGRHVPPPSRGSSSATSASPEDRSRTMY